MTSFPGVALLCCLAAEAAAAQGLVFQPEATDSCVASAADLAGREACVGRSADACMDTPDGATTVGMSYCVHGEHTYWSARLTGAYRTLLELETATDSDLSELGSAAPSPAAALREMERTWTAYRDAACAYEVSTWGGGSGGGPAGADCMMRLTARQALVLEDRLRVAAGP